MLSDDPWPSSWDRKRFPIGWACLMLPCVAGLIAWRFPSAITHPASFVAIMATLVASWLGAVWAFWRSDKRAHLAAVAAFGLLARLLFVLAPPELSGDVYRYLWDGQVLRQGLNPYATPPTPENAEALGAVAYDKMNHRSVKTVYPPLAQAAFALAGDINNSPRSFKAMAALFDVACAGLIVLALRRRELPTGRVVAWAASPIVLVEFAGHGHSDAMGVAFLLLALLSLDAGRERSSVAALAGGVLVKFYPVVFAPLVAMRLRDRRWILALPALVALAYVPFLGAGPSLVEGLGRYADTWAFNGSVYELLRWATGDRTVAKILIAVVTAAIVALLAWRRVDPWRAGAVIGLCWILGTPTAHVWYVAWALAFLPFTGSPTLFWLGATLPFAHLASIHEMQTGAFALPPWFAFVEYGPVVPLLAWEIWRARRSTT
ncbi:MAG: hypothetical protein H6684_03860 [Deltaproteobacteria bacterium]|nr:hypothetical protein [Deltaproteobacteria bacterium]